jgi:hypothetical protein
MDTILDILFNRAGHLFDRAGGPLNFRLVVMPTVVTILAILADRRDAREGRPALLGAFFTDPAERRRLFRSALKDIGRVFLVAIVLDTLYQLMVFRWVYPGEVLVVALACAIVPYVLVRGPIIRLLRMLLGTRKGSGTTGRGSGGGRHE